ncbi:SgcJ/EcaC family oxidoreductase [Nocardia sp. NBC_01388]|uniref:SgcJ/EcaC family oxidoreductase n=1 Tax=Nocardia sp. NBC_01388 TaxID=2903596 RepID=UPI00324812BF
MNDIAVQTDERAAVLAVIDGVYGAWANNDADALAANFDADASSVTPGWPGAGREAVRARFAAAFAGPWQGSRVVDEPSTVRFLNPDTAIVVGRSAVQLPGKSETEPPVLGTWVIARPSGQWLVHAFHSCAA